MNGASTGEAIPFNRPVLAGREEEYVNQVIAGRKFSGNREYAGRCTDWLRRKHGSARALLTSSGTHSLEMAALLAEIGPEDEVIVASFGFSSTANAFALRGARLVFVDVRADTMNLDETLLAEAITGRTRAIALTHYAGVACEMDAILKLAEQHNLVVIEDAAHALLASYRGRACGSMGRFACFSFHETKNLHCGEGGAILINAESDQARAEIIQEKGTDRSRFHRGQVDKYSWVDIGSSYLLNELSAAFLWAQLERGEEITRERLSAWERYRQGLAALASEGRIELPVIPRQCEHNAHCFYLKAMDEAERDALIDHLAARGIQAVFHYIPLHSSLAGQRFGRFHGEDRITTRDSSRLLRLPMFHGLTDAQIDRVVEEVGAFYS